MPFQLVEKHGGNGELMGAVITRSKDGRTMYVTLGQDVVASYGLRDRPYMEMHCGTGRDTGQLLLVRSSKEKGYRCDIDETGKGRLSAIQPRIVKEFCNGHRKIYCTVQNHEGGILLIGNGRGQ